MITYIKKIELVPVFGNSATEYKITEMQKVIKDYRINGCDYRANIILYKSNHKNLTLIGRATIGRVSDVTPNNFKKANGVLNKIIQDKCAGMKGLLN